MKLLFLQYIAKLQQNKLMIKIGESISFKNTPLLLAPMEDVSDPPFRYVCKKNGADLMYTEFISSEGLIRDTIKSKMKLDIFEYERPIGVQIFGSDIDSMVEATHIAAQVQPDLIDINYGCPVKNVACRGAGAGILQDPDKMVHMTEAIVKATPLPVTVKTRLGWDDTTKNIDTIAERLQDIGIQALTIHGRTRVQMYKGIADWNMIGKIKVNPRIKIPIFGNGDIDSAVKAKEYLSKYNVDGIMIGRAAIGNPWIFDQIKQYLHNDTIAPTPTIQARVEAARTHFIKSIEWKGERLGVLEMRRHYSNYLKGLPDIKPYRQALVTTNHIPTILELLDEIVFKYRNVHVDYLTHQYEMNRTLIDA